ncbi:tripartite tricarboxylate transporter permease [Methanobacterium lacus]|uniref:tripartite tricarboxylate transporter permease n=1 Tax=Methanobacterium lacus (strain AL-21) TaxID=877455 RepID=UPI001D0FDD9C|nr:tripartite tricarboxylate transporter permease [Methanobacterium lacus]
MRSIKYTCGDKILDLLLACVFGVLVGVFTGMVPGIHVNTVAAFVFSSSVYLMNYFSPEYLAVFLISLSISHSLIDFIPTMFLGVPDEGTALSVLPGHYLMLQGRGKEAIRLVTLGGFGSLMVTVTLLPIFIMLLPGFYSIIKPYIALILTFTAIYMVLRLNKGIYEIFWSSVIFIFSGIIGWASLNSTVSPNVLLLTIFSGFFGVSTLIYSLSQNSYLPYQHENHNLRVDGKIIRGIFAGGIAGTILGFLPGMGPAQGSILAQEMSGGGNMTEGRESFLVAMSGVNVSDALFSLITIYIIGNPRSGVAVFIDKLIQNFDLQILVMFVFVSVTAVSISVFFCISLGDFMIKNIHKLNYNKLSRGIIILMSALVIIFTLKEGSNLFYVIILYITSISLGLIPHYVGVNKSNLMGVLIVPAIVIYTGLV